jgi:hypothetical protein
MQQESEHCLSRVTIQSFSVIYLTTTCSSRVSGNYTTITHATPKLMQHFKQQQQQQQTIKQTNKQTNEQTNKNDVTRTSS